MSEKDLFEAVGVLDSPPKKDYEELKETSTNYLKRKFPMEAGEILVKYCPVGVNNFRINFYKEQDSDNFFKAQYINRSYFVVLTENKKSWKHTIK